MPGQRANPHCMPGQLAAELYGRVSLCGIAMLAPEMRHLESDTRHGLPSPSPECHRYPGGYNGGMRQNGVRGTC
jgi:hypothetical protein